MLIEQDYPPGSKDSGSARREAQPPEWLDRGRVYDQRRSQAEIANRSSQAARIASPYAEPPAEPPPLSDCLFYHAIDLPGLGVKHGQWDLRPGIDEYLGPTDYRGLRVLEIGTANGFVCFELEKRGAEVVAVDLPEPATYDVRPGAEQAVDPEAMRSGLRQIRNAWWLGHALLSSSAKVAYAHVNDLPAEIGHFDVVLLANVLQHCREPVSALLNVARFADSVVVTESDWMVGSHDDIAGLVLFEGPAPAPYSWFQVKPPLVSALLAELGLVDQQLTRHEQLLVEDMDYGDLAPRRREWGGLAVPHFTVTARRP